MPRTKVVPYSIEKDGVTQSMLATWTACRQRSKWRLEGWRPVALKPALSFGSMWHWAMSALYRAYAAAVPLPKVEDLVVAYGIMAKEELARLEPKDREIQLGMLEALYPAYVAWWKPKDGKARWEQVESVFSVPYTTGAEFPQITTRLRGRIDGAFTLGKGKRELWLLESKTASALREDTLSLTLAYDWQCLFYVTAMELTLRRKVTGVVYNVVRKPSLRLGKSESLLEYCNRMKEDVWQARPDTYFARFELGFPEEVKAEFRRQLDAKIRDMSAWEAGSRNGTYRNESACVGRWNCEYIAACAAGSPGATGSYEQTGQLFSELQEGE